jgi:gamma-glutamylcyclotransferase
MASPPRLYFAYGSNLSVSQMSLRCRGSTYQYLGVLKDYRWIIGSRGYANIVPVPSSEQHVVYGMLYTLMEADEECLDVAEGVSQVLQRKLPGFCLFQEMGNLERGDIDLSVSAAPDASSTHFSPSARAKY